jgi:cobalt-zinc-cadmium efflux system membrane fusion protein
MNRRTLSTLLLAGVGLGALSACEAKEDPFAVSAAETVTEELSDRFQLPVRSSGAELLTAIAGPTELTQRLTLPGEITFNEDRRATVSAGVEGVISEVDVRLGDVVQPGQRLLLISSRDLARSRSAYVEATHHMEFATAAFEREERLWKRGITPEETYLSALHTAEEAALLQLTTGQELRAMGLSEAELERLAGWCEADEASQSSLNFMHYALRSPQSGVVVEKAAVLGEVVAADTMLFEVADLGTVWVDLSIRAAQLAQLKVGTPVRVESAELGRVSEARVSYLDARVDPETQAGLAHIELENEDGAWRPGLFVTVEAEVGRSEVPLSVPLASILVSPGGRGGQTVSQVFVRHADGSFEARVVELGRSGAHAVEVLSGLQPGERVAAEDVLVLKSIWLGQGGLEE